MLPRRTKCITRRVLSATLLLLVALSVCLVASYKRLLVDVLQLGSRGGGPAASLVVVLSAPRAAASEVKHTLDAVFASRRVAALRPHVVLYAHERHADALRRLSRVSAVVVADHPAEAFLRYVTSNYYASLPDFVLFAAAAPGARSAVRSALRAFDGATHLLPLAPAVGCSCDTCGNTTFAAAARDLRGAAARLGTMPPCVEPYKSFADGAFVVSRVGIHRQPLSFYTEALSMLRDELEDAADGGASSDAVYPPAARHGALEAAWTRLFACVQPDRVTCAGGASGAGAGALTVRRKTVWLLWLSGWERVPWLVQQVEESWRFHNPGWRVELVTEANLARFVNIPYIHAPHISPPAKSDIIRLHLLAAHGGVWADATVLCMQPLDEWLPQMLRPVGFWMYHGTGWPPPKPITHANTIYPASWFMVARRGAYIATAWRDAADAYWGNHTKGTDNYFWMDVLFRQLMVQDARFMADWRNVPFISCEDPGQAHMLVRRVLKPCDERVAALLRTNPPFVLKLSHHGFPAEERSFTRRTRRTAGYIAVQASKTRTKAPDGGEATASSVFEASS